MTTEKEIEEGISDIVGALTDPIIVYPGGWGDDTPEWVKAQITLERLAMNMRALKGEEPTGTDAEACAYLMSASLSFPLDHDWAQIYLYVSGKTIRFGKKADMPTDIDVQSLTESQMRKLNELQAIRQAHHKEEQETKDRGYTGEVLLKGKE